MPVPVIRRARPGEAGLLSRLALRSKSHWGYSSEFLAACEDELSYSADQFDDEQFCFFVAEHNTTPVGFYATRSVDGQEYELEALFVDPAKIGSGIGRQLLQHAVRSVAKRGGRTLLIQGDPNATDFYKAAGGKQVGTRESGSIPGRQLPLFRIDIAAAIGRTAAT